MEKKMVELKCKYECVSTGWFLGLKFNQPTLLDKLQLVNKGGYELAF
jgi:hypothetical protein